MTDSNHTLSAPDQARANAINVINGATSNISKKLVSAGDVAVASAAAQVALAMALVYVGECVREMHNEHKIEKASKP